MVDICGTYPKSITYTAQGVKECSCSNFSGKEITFMDQSYHPIHN
jgi:hypothetical protein